ncbi:MAG: hypothetical protein JXR86_04675 [Spirochaetales bacterium]|nr:hypothetical protein [Spirochaetales bacterium]
MDAFSEIVNLNSKSFDIAMMKFCYVDIDETTDITLLFSQYKEMMDELESQFPDMTFAAVTAPLMERQGGFKSFVKKILGRKIYGRADNLKRHLFNNLIRENFDIVFDLAEIESTAPDGAKLRHEMNGQEYPSLYPGYTDDGGHLNKAGRENMAYGFLKFISEIQ